MTQFIKKRSRRVALALAAALSGGSVFGACEARFKSAFVDGTTSFVQSGLLPLFGTAASGATVSFTADPFEPETKNDE
ncbi:MAG: hypothetical protein IH897_10585 [Planctomycetes bacterium]|nr:hypothetical protein [Planctomycetota bacterium]